MANLSVGQKLNYTYTGAKQSVTLPPGTYKLEVWGAQGGYRSDSSKGGKGGYSAGTIKITVETTFYIYVGGAGGSSTSATSTVITGGFNGGGYRYGYKGGGGGTDIRVAVDSLYARVIVAGGGGSDGASGKQGMYGGGTNGGAATENYGSHGEGGSQTGNTANTTVATSQYKTNSTSNWPGGFGFGGFGVYTSSGYGGAGGGGWYGGCGAVPDGSGDDDRGGGGGSGYVYTSSSASNYPSGCKLNSSHYLTSTMLKGGNESFTDYSGSNVTGHTGNGAARITVVEIAIKPPTNLKSTVKERIPTLTWTASADSVTGYNVYLGTTKVGTVSGTTYTHTSQLTPGTSYTFTVKAYNNSGESTGVSTTVNFSAPAPPTNLQAILVDGTYYLSWSPSTSANVDKYNIYYGDSKELVGSSTTNEFEYPFPRIQTRAPDISASPDSDIPQGGTNYRYYGFYVKSHTSVSESTGDATAYVAVPNLPDPPSNLRFESVKDSLAYIVWDYTGDTMEDNVSLLDGYKVYVDGSLVAKSTNTKYDCYLSPGKTHTIEVYSYNGAGESTSASTLSLSYSLPSPPARIDAAIQDGELLLTWPASVSEGVVAYRVYLGDQVLIGTTPWEPKFLFPLINNSLVEKELIMGEKRTLTSFFQPIEASREYTFSVSSVNEYGEGDKVSIRLKAYSAIAFDEIKITPNPTNTNSPVTISAAVTENLNLTILD